MSGPRERRTSHAYQYQPAGRIARPRFAAGGQAWVAQVSEGPAGGRCTRWLDVAVALVRRGPRSCSRFAWSGDHVQC